MTLAGSHNHNGVNGNMAKVGRSQIRVERAGSWSWIRFLFQVRETREEERNSCLGFPLLLVLVDL